MIRCFKGMICLVSFLQLLLDVSSVDVAFSLSISKLIYKKIRELHRVESVDQVLHFNKKPFCCPFLHSWAQLTRKVTSVVRFQRNYKEPFCHGWMQRSCILFKRTERSRFFCVLSKKNAVFFAFFYILYKRMLRSLRSLRSFTFFIKERGVAARESAT